MDEFPGINRRNLELGFQHEVAEPQFNRKARLGAEKLC